MSPQDVARHLCVSFDDFAERAVRHEAPNDWNGVREELLVWIFTVETDVAFHGLFQVLETQTRYQYQWLAGDLLLRALIPCPPILVDFIVRAAPRFNASADTVPKYLGAIFGKEAAVEERLRQLRTSQSDSRCIAAIDGMRYGLGEHPDQS